MEEEAINFGVKISIPNKVVICWVVKGDFCQRKTITKVIEEVVSGLLGLEFASPLRNWAASGCLSCASSMST